MYSNGKFVNNCKSVGPMRIRQHTLSPSRWPTPHLSFSFLFFFSPLFFIFRFLLISLHHISSFSLKENHKPKHQTQFSSSKKIQHHRLEKQKSIFLHLSLPLFSFFFFLLLFFFFPFPGFGWQLHWQFFWIWVCTQRPKACLFYIIFWIWMTASISIFLGFFFCFFLF